MDEIKPGFDGLPPKKDSYEDSEKALLVAKAAEIGTHVVAKAYGMNWHRIASWKKYYARNVVFTEAASKYDTRTIILQSPSKQEISLAEVLTKIKKFDKVYIRVDENKIYWVKDQDNGAIDIW